MNLNEYQKYTERTAPKIEEGEEIDALLNFTLGLTGEAGEYADHVKKALYQGHKLDREKMAKELGDSLWYIARNAELLGYELDEIAQMNIDKLNKRYPNGFSAEDSKNRVDVKGVE